MIKNADKYSVGSKTLHWVIAVIAIAMLGGSFFLNDLAKTMQPFAYMMHKSFGLTILLLMLARIGWIWHMGTPALPVTMPLWEQVLAKTVRYALYLFLLAMPLCGWIMSCASGRAPVYFGLFKWSLPGIVVNHALEEWFKQTHNTIAWILIILITLHIIAALKHYFIDKDEIMQRMF